MTGRSLSGMFTNRGESDRHNSRRPIRYAKATSFGSGVITASGPAHSTTGVITKPERVG